MGKKWLNFIGVLSLWGLAAAIVWNGYVTKESKPSDLTKAKIEETVHDYLLKNPRLLIEMEDRLRAQEQAEEEAAVARIQSAVGKEFKTMLAASGELSGITGQPGKDYILWYFTQPKCPSCHRADHLVQEMVNAHPELEERIFYWPFFGGEALKIAKLVMAAAQQNLAAELYRAVINYQGAITLEQVQKLAAALPGVDMAKLLQKAECQQLAKRLKGNFILANKLHMTGTPTIIITDKTGSRIEIISGFNDNLKRDLESKFRKVQQPQKL